MKKLITICLLTFFHVVVHAQLPSGGLVAWYPFCGNANDYSGNGRDLTVRGPTLTTDRFGSSNCAYYFPGNTVGINNTLHCTPPMPTDATDFTYSCWLEPDSIGVRQIIANGHCDIDGYELSFMGTTCCITPGNYIAILFGGINMYLPTPVALHQWHHAAMRRTGNIYDLTVDTISAGSFTGVFNPTNISEDFAVGQNYFSGVSPFKGKIDDIAVYNRALSDAEIKQLYYYNPVCTIVPVVCDSIVLPDTITVCMNSSVTMPTSVVGAYAPSTISWSPPTGLSATGILDPILSVGSASRWYYITIEFDNISDQVICVATDSVYINVKWQDTISSHFSISQCASKGPVTLDAPVGYGAYLWNTGSTSPSITTDISGTYWVNALNGSCRLAADTFNISLNPSPLVFLGNDTTICSGTFFSLGSSQPPGSIFLWSNGAKTSFIDVSEGGSYSLNVTLNGCSASDSIRITEIPAPVIKLGNDTTLCSGYILPLHITAQDAVYLWNNGSTGQNIEVSETGTYWATASNICGVASDTLIAAFVNCNTWFPAAFTPNGDGKNDIIRLEGALAELRDFSFSVYNRWGQRVFYTKDIYDGWDGTFDGVKQDVGTYFYMIFYSLNGKKNMMKGDFELIR